MAEKKKKILIPNTTQIPNLILDLVLPRIPEPEARCLLYICRRTFGFHKEEDCVSFTQFQYGIKSSQGKVLDFGTGLSRPAINKALHTLIKVEAIFVTKRAQGNRYRLNLQMAVDKVVNDVNQLRKFTNTGKRGLPELVNTVNLQKKEKKEKQSIRKDVENLARIDVMRKDLIQKMTVRRSASGDP